MSRVFRLAIMSAALVAAGVAGFQIARNPVALPPAALEWIPQGARQWLPANARSTPAAATGPVIYYRDPDGKPFYSADPKKAGDGRHWIAVHASEDLNFDDSDAPPKAAETASPRKILFYRNPMGLPDTSPAPKKDSMGMDYIPVFEGEDDDGATIRIAPGKVQRAGVKTDAVKSRVLTHPVRAPATIQLDERRVSVVALRFDAFLENVADVTTGSPVRKGDRLMRVYSAEILAAAAQFRSTLGQRSDIGDARPAIDGARRRLENMGIPADAIAAIEKTRDVPRAIDWYAPREGIVLERGAVEGMRATAGEALFRLADVSIVWALVDVAERDIGAIKPGDRAAITVRGMPGRMFEGRIDLILPQVNMATRTTRVRIELANPDGALMPNMFADAEIATGSDKPVLAVPDSAVIDSGRRRIVILDRGEGRFEPREVKTGIRGDGYVEIREGLSENDQIVVSANFLIDAESNLKSALRGLEQGNQPK